MCLSAIALGTRDWMLKGVQNRRRDWVPHDTFSSSRQPGPTLCPWTWAVPTAPWPGSLTLICSRIYTWVIHSAPTTCKRKEPTPAMRSSGLRRKEVLGTSPGLTFGIFISSLALPSSQVKLLPALSPVGSRLPTPWRASCPRERVRSA